jgi:hypothetical protein
LRRRSLPDMRRLLPRTTRSLGNTLRLLDRVAGEINPYLFMFAIGLAALYLSWLFMLVSTALLQNAPAPAAGPTLSAQRATPAVSGRKGGDRGLGGGMDGTVECSASDPCARLRN